MNTPMLLAALSMMGTGGTLLAFSLKRLARSEPDPIPLDRPRRTPPDRQAFPRGIPAVGRAATESPTRPMRPVRRSPPPLLAQDFTSRQTPAGEHLPAVQVADVAPSERPTDEVEPVRGPRPQRSTAVVQVSQELLTRSTPPWRRPRAEPEKK
jgi:hypothetical protein